MKTVCCLTCKHLATNTVKHLKGFANCKVEQKAWLFKSIEFERVCTKHQPVGVTVLDRRKQNLAKLYNEKPY